MPDRGDRDPSSEQHQQHTPADNEASERPQSAERRLRRRKRWIVIGGLGVAAIVAIAILTGGTGSKGAGSTLRSRRRVTRWGRRRRP
jgi:hypothetical protein